MSEFYVAHYLSPVGLLKVSATDSAVSEITFCEQKEQVLSEPPAPHGSPPVLTQCIDELTAYFNGETKIFRVPLHQEGSPFQLRVWNELLKIPFGKTISYLELAKRLGDAKVIRAAASTNGKNRLAVIVPCHRVIGSGNDLVGYAGGLSRKRWLLQHEAKWAHGVQTLF